MKVSFPTFKSFCERFSLQNQSSASRKPTQSLVCKCPTLIDVDLCYGKGNAVAWLIWHLQHFQEQINVPNKMTPVQIEACAQMIADRYFHLKTTELMMFFFRLAGGVYGVEWHGYVMPDIIVNALRDKYMPWRNDLLYKIEKQEEKRRRREESEAVHLTRDEWEFVSQVTKEYDIFVEYNRGKWET